MNERIHREKIAYESRLLLLPGQRAELVGPTAVALRATEQTLLELISAYPCIRLRVLNRREKTI